jgi:peptide chain release factor 1
MTDHRINYTSHNLSAIMDGELDELIHEMTLADRMKRLQENKTEV